MRFTGTDRGDDSEPWFRLGQLAVSSTVLVLLVWVATLVVFIAEPVSKPVQEWLALYPGQVTSGEVWRVITWPWSHTGFGLFDIVGAALFFLFGTDLERQVGRTRFGWLLASSIVIIGLAATVLSSLLPGETVIADLDLLGLTVLLLYIAEHPTRPFFFGIPAWVIGAVIVALEVVNDLAFRDWIRLLTIIVAAALIALVARKVDLLTAYDKVPDLGLPGGEGRRERKARKAAARGGSRAAAPRRGAAARPPRPAAPERSRPGRLWGKRDAEPEEPAEIIPMRPPSRRTLPPSSTPDASADDLALDLLLDKISQGGMESLTDEERTSLSDLRERRLR